MIKLQFAMSRFEYCLCNFGLVISISSTTDLHLSFELIGFVKEKLVFGLHTAIVYMCARFIMKKKQ